MFSWQCLGCIRVPVTMRCFVFVSVCLSSNFVSMSYSPTAVSAVGQCMFKKSGFQPLSPLQISLSLSISPPHVVCFSSLFPCGAKVMCFGTVHLLLDKENDLPINVPSAPQHGWWGKEWDVVRTEAKDQGHMREREGCSPLGLCSPCRLSAQVLQLR